MKTIITILSILLLSSCSESRSYDFLIIDEVQTCNCGDNYKYKVFIKNEHIFGNRHIHYTNEKVYVGDTIRLTK